MNPKPVQKSRHELVSALQEARARTLELISDLTDEQMIGPRLAIVNPLRWELGHMAYFQEFWVLRHFRKESPLSANSDSLYDSARIPHDTRWDLPLPPKTETLAYLEQVLERIVAAPQRGQTGQRPLADGYDEAYFIRLALLHEYMHAEAITYTRQTLGYPAPKLDISEARSGKRLASAAKAADPPQQVKVPRGRQLRDDAEVPGGAFFLGSTRDASFVFDNEQWAHPVTVQPFRIARTAVSNAEFAAFVDDGGYKRGEFWTEEGWRWRADREAGNPVYWQKQANGRWLRRDFDEWVPLEAHLPVLHVNWYEADAYCRWAGRRLPTEAEWEMAASAEPTPGGSGVAPHKRQYPWGDEPPSPRRANLEWRAMSCVDVGALSAGDSAFGCRQMIGNVWEWTATNFGPYPGFSPGPYKEYSAPWFGNHKVLRGGCWATRSGLIRNNYRNFYQPHRRDVWAGFRSCAVGIET
ncbi:MAG: selenoneine synthase SenA [Terriglobia bacterium]